ncbi:plasmid segregation actin-type ATPase ParM [Lachnospiraceae bacterium]|nr:plasmid segregation actin-type ATPase ParM [Lachnospiraceae bacterium]
MKNPEIIAIDHGWSMCKTPNDIYISGVSEITTEPAYFDNVLEFKGRFYKIGSGRSEVRATKVETPDYYHLTLAGIAKELSRRKTTEARVILSVGLPASRYGDEKNDFIKYLKQNDEVYFKFERIKYHVWIEDVYVYPQCYAAVIDQVQMFGPKVVVVDIGSWTIDIIPVINKLPDEAGTDSIPQGIITCMRNINKECVRQFGESIDEELIKEYMVTKKSMLPEGFIQIMDREIKSFLSMVVNSLREEKYSLKTTPFIFVGGGAVVMKNFGGYDQENFTYKTDICANAKGFEQIAKYRVSQGGDN